MSFSQPTLRVSAREQSTCRRGERRHGTPRRRSEPTTKGELPMKGIKYVVLALVVLAAAAGAGRARAAGTLSAGDAHQACHNLFEDAAYALPARIGHPHSYEVYY